MQHRSVVSRRALALLAVVAIGATACQSANGSQANASTTTLPALTPTTLELQTTVPTTVATTLPPTTLATTTTVAETTTTVAPTTTEPATTTTAAPAIPVLDPALKAVGTKGGAETSRVQQRLLDLGFWLTAADGNFDLTTRQAVLAFQKYYGLPRTSKVDNATAQLLSTTTTRVQGNSTQGSEVEVDKDRQVLMIIHDGITVWALNTATGSGQYYLELSPKTNQYESGRAVTPSGTFKTTRERPDGWWEGDLGKIYRPKYFNGGIAIHGMTSVPAQPASHGCVRVSLPAMDMIWDSGLIPLGTRVVVSGNDVAPKGPPPNLPPAPPPTAAPDPSTVPTPGTPAPEPATTTPATAPPAAPDTTVAAPASS